MKSYALENDIPQIKICVGEECTQENRSQFVLFEGKYLRGTCSRCDILYKEFVSTPD